MELDIPVAKQKNKTELLEVILDDAGCFVSTNSEFEQLFGHSNLHEQCKSFLVYTHPLDLRVSNQTIDNSQQGEITSFRSRYKTKSGQFKWIQWQIERGQNQIKLVGQDITKNKIQEQYNAKIHRVIEETSDFVGIADLFGNVIYVNDAGKRIVGVGESFDETNVHLSYFHPKWAENEVINVAIPTSMENGKWKGRLALKNNEGKEIPVSAVIMSHKDDNNEISHFSCIMRDISESLKQEETIRRQQKEYLALFNHISDSILIVNATSLVIQDCNNTFLDKFQLKKENVITNTIFDLYDEKNSVEIKIAIQSLKQNKVAKFNVIQFATNGNFYHVEVIAENHRYFDQNSILWMIKDVTDQMRSETKLRLYAEQLQYSNQHLKNLYSKLQVQSDELSERNKDFIESITYAKKIQNAIFPDQELISSIFKESFVLFKPKSIVSGDFYWFFKNQNTVIVAVGDCTGHGVPGAFMSMIGITVLNEIVKNKRIFNPAQILTYLNKTVVKTLKQKGVDFENRDGMDIGITTIDINSKTMHYAGANRNLHVAKDQTIEIIPGTRTSIGGFREIPKKFESTSINYEKISAVYMSTDGYADQFGGPKLKKFSTKRYLELLHELSNKSSNEQLSKLNSTLKNWKGSEEQLDDILIAGFNPNSIQEDFNV